MRLSDIINETTGKRMSRISFSHEFENYIKNMDLEIKRTGRLVYEVDNKYIMKIIRKPGTVIIRDLASNEIISRMKVSNERDARKKISRFFKKGL